MTQINIYSRETHITEEGWEEPAEVIFVSLIDVDKTVDFSVGADQYIEIHGPTVLEIQPKS